MEELPLYNYLEPIAKIWANAAPTYPASRLKKQKIRKRRKHKKLAKRLPKKAISYLYI
jgi:hypothetical protein